MPQLQIGTTDKRINSTKQTFTSAYTHDCKLKEPCSMQSPVFLLEGLAKGTFYNYAKFEDKYYWIDDIVYTTRNLQEVYCHLDPLATFYEDIKNTYAWVQYGDKAHWNKWIDDVRFNPEVEDTDLSLSSSVKLFNAFEDGMVYMNYMDTGSWGPGGTQGGVKCIAMTVASFSHFLTNMYSFCHGDPSSVIAEKIGGYGSWRDNIISCLWTPFKVKTNGGLQIQVGSVTCVVDDGVQLAPYNYTVETKTLPIDFSFANNYPYLKNNRWTVYQLSTPFGYISIPIESIVNQANIYLTTSAIVNTGEVLLTVTEDGNISSNTADSLVLGQLSGNVCFNLMEYMGNGQGFFEGLGNSMALGAKMGVSALSVGMAVSSTAINNASASRDEAMDIERHKRLNEIVDLNIPAKEFDKTMSHMSLGSGVSAAGAIALTTGIGPSCPSGGAQGGLASLRWNGNFCKGTLTRKVFNIADKLNYENFCNRYGYPVNNYLNLATVNGFCKTSAASVNITNGSPANIASVNSMLNAGIYIED